MKTRLHAAPAATPDTGDDLDSAREAALVGSSLTDGAGEDTHRSQTPVLITEQEVVFSTSAAPSLPRTKTTRGFIDATRVAAATLRRMFLTAMTSPDPSRRHYPSRCIYFERAIMSREMDRL